MRPERWLAWLGVLMLAGCAGSGMGMRKTSSADQEAAKLQVKLGQEYLTKGELETAQGKLRRALELDPRSADAYTLLAVLNERIQRPEAAEQNYRRALELRPEDGATNNNYGAFLCGSGRYADAEPYFKKAIEDPFYKTPALAFANAGLCARKAGKNEIAEQQLRRALELDPRNLSALLELARINAERGKYLYARAFIERYDASARSEPEVLLLAADIEHKLGDLRAAAQYRERLARQYPEYAVPEDNDGTDSP